MKNSNLIILCFLGISIPFLKGLCQTERDFLHEKGEEMILEEKIELNADIFIDGIRITNLREGEVINGIFELKGLITGNFAGAKVIITLNDDVGIEFQITEETVKVGKFNIPLSTSQYPNGITTIKAILTDGNVEYKDEVIVNIVNIPSATFPASNWRLLITEVHPNPYYYKAEFFELTNSFPFDVLLSNWTVGTSGGHFYTFETGYVIPKYSSLVFVRDVIAFEQSFEIIPDIEFSFELSNTKDYIYLQSSNKTNFDAVKYGYPLNDLDLDPSEVNDAPKIGESLSRFPLYQDTNTVKDFILSEPSPKATVPQFSFETSTEAPFNFSFFLISLITIVVIRKHVTGNK